MPPNGICASSCTVGAVDVADAGLDPLGDTRARAAMSRVNTAADRPYSVSLAIAHRLVVAVDADDRRRPGRSFLAVDAHVRRHVVDHGRRSSACPRPCRRRRAGALADRVVDQRLQRGRAASAADQRAERRPCPRADRRPTSVSALAANLATKASATFSSTMIRSVDMQIWPWFMKAPKAAAVDRLVEVGVVEHDQRRLAAEFEQHRLQVLAPRSAAMIRPTRVEPVKLMRRTAGCAISASTTAGASSGALVTTLTHAVGQAGLAQRFDDQPVRARADFRGLQDHGVAAGQRHGDGAHAEDDRRVPRRDAEHHAGRLAHRHGDAAGLVGRDHLAGDLGGHRRRLAQHAGGQHDVEAGPAGGGAGLGPSARRTPAPCWPACRRP